METRWHMNSTDGRWMVEEIDQDWLKEIRRTDRRFFRARIKSVIQAYPSRIMLGAVYERTYH